MMQTASVAFESRLAAGLAEGHLDIGDQVCQVQIPLSPLDQIVADLPLSMPEMVTPLGVTPQGLGGGD